MATKQVKKQTKAKKQETRDFQSNVIQFSSVKKTRNGGLAVFIGKNVVFLNKGLLDYINNKKAS